MTQVILLNPLKHAIVHYTQGTIKIHYVVKNLGLFMTQIYRLLYPFILIQIYFSFKQKNSRIFIISSEISNNQKWISLGIIYYQNQ